MEMEKQDRMRQYADDERKRMEKKYVEGIIPTDHPLYDELHMKFYRRYQDKMAQDREVVNFKEQKFGTPLSTEEYGMLH